MKIKTKPIKTLKKFKKLPMAFIPQFPYIKEVSVKKAKAKKKKAEPNDLDKVTVDKILEVIEKIKTVRGHKVRWFLDGEDLEMKVPDHNIRAVIKTKKDVLEFCPITFYCYIKTGKFTDLLYPSEAGKKSRIPSRICDDIRDAADDILPTPKLRRRLLQATGLLEQARKNGEKI